MKKPEEGMVHDAWWEDVVIALCFCSFGAFIVTSIAGAWKLFSIPTIATFGPVWGSTPVLLLITTTVCAGIMVVRTWYKNTKLGIIE